MKPETSEHEKQRRELLNLIDEHGLSARRDAIAALLRPAIGLRTRAPVKADLAVGATRVGGQPDLPPCVAWPEGDDGPLLFVLQVQLAEVAALDLEERLPEDGLLVVFSDPWARDVRVHHFAAGVELAPHATPVSSMRPPFRACGVDALAELHLPPSESAFFGTVHEVLDSDERDAYHDGVWLTWRERQRPGVAGEAGIHQLLGYAVAERYEAQALDEEVLIGFDSDDRAAMEWGDVHCVWVLIRRGKLAERAFGELHIEM